MRISENIKIALRSIRGTLLRTIITATIIAIGITALVGMLTAIEGLEVAINKNFSRMGANTFTIKDKSGKMEVFGTQKQTKYESIKYLQTRQFKENFEFPATVAVSAVVSFQGILKSNFAKTNPNNRILAIDEDYLELSASDIYKGRNFSQFEISEGSPVAVIGYDIATGLFPKGKAIDSFVSYNGVKFKVVGILEKKGGSIGFGGEDRMMYIPINRARSLYLSNNTNYVILVGVSNGNLIDVAIDEAKITLRKIRKLHPGEEDNFEIFKSNSATEDLLQNLKALTLSATIISLITLIGAAIGLMNIMLVSVTERTREIGTRMALGARPKTILSQFLTEAIVICIIGGLAGIVLGIAIGNIVGMMMSTGFIVPWLWILIALTICIVVGLLAGIYPARKAAKLNPIDALRYE
ncbi:MAG: ABC transporter permease [Bacteroidia bacterium]|nr:ABC transporter permease [Bacteroidia bacterium]